MDEAIEREVEDIEVDEQHLRLCTWITLAIYIHV
jgi:hypothetical protein